MFEQIGRLQNALSAFLGALRGNLTKSELQRIHRYAELRQNYKGWYTPYDAVTRSPLKGADGQPLVVPIKYNFNRPIAHLATSFLSKLPVEFTFDRQARRRGVSPPRSEQALYDLWKAADGQCRFREAALLGAVETEGYFKWVPMDDGPPQLRVIAPTLVFPRFDPHDIRVLAGATVTYNVMRDNAQVVYREEHAPGQMLVYYDDKLARDESLEWDGDYMLMVHAPNHYYPGDACPTADIEPTLALVREYDWIADKYRRIVDRYANPNLVVRGATPDTVKSVRKGLDDVFWLPNENSDMSYLQWAGDVPAVSEELDRIKEDISTVSQTPAIALSNSAVTGQLESGVALRILFAPLVDKTEDKRVTWESTLRRVLQTGFLVQGQPAPEGFELVWQDPTPENEQWLSQIVSERVAAGTLSRTGGMDLLGVENPEEEFAKAVSEAQAWEEASSPPPMPVMPPGEGNSPA